MPARSDRIALMAALCLAMSLAGAAEPRWPSPTDMEEARRARPLPVVPMQEPSHLPRIDPRRPSLDIESLIRRHSLQPGEGQEPLKEAPLRIFVTLDMPAQSLRALAAQAGRAGVTLVLRGLKDQSMTKTLAAVQSILDGREVAWQIDPQAFTRFGVTRAPTFLLATGSTSNAPCVEECSMSDTFVSVSGDVSLDYALEAMGRQVHSSRSQIALYLARLRRQ